MTREDTRILTDYWRDETTNLNNRVDDAFRDAQNHAYELGWNSAVEACAMAAEKIINDTDDFTVIVDAIRGVTS